MITGKIKNYPQDFIVEEQLGFDLEGSGEHLWCFVEKSGMNTAFIERQWAKACACPQRMITHSGLKDRHALTRQWLCLPAKLEGFLPESYENGDEYWKMLSKSKHRKKLHIGTHKTNYFEITVRDIVGAKADIETRLNEIKARGFKNVFGQQRFGHNNLIEAMRWVACGNLPSEREVRSRVLSTLRSVCFNAELDAREKEGKLYQAITGDQLQIAGSNSFFTVDAVTDDLATRLLSHEILVQGWLPGSLKKEKQGKVWAFREKALEQYQEVIHYLEQHMEAGWRPMLIPVPSFIWDWKDEATLVMKFTLPAGAYATTLLENIFDHVKDMGNSV